MSPNKDRKRSPGKITEGGAHKKTGPRKKKKRIGDARYQVTWEEVGGLGGRR